MTQIPSSPSCCGAKRLELAYGGAKLLCRSRSHQTSKTGRRRHGNDRKTARPFPFVHVRQDARGRSPSHLTYVHQWMRSKEHGNETTTRVGHKGSSSLTDENGTSAYSCMPPRVSSDCWTRELPEKRQTTEVYIYILRNRFKACTQDHRKDYDRKRSQQLETTDNLIIVHAKKSLQRNRDSPNASETRVRSDNAEFKK